MTLFTPLRLITTVRGRRYGQPGFTRRMQYGWSEPLGARRRLLALLVSALGLLTFFVPLVSIDPPVAGRTYWSPFNVADEMYQGRLPKPTWCERCGEPIVSSVVALPLDISIDYLILVLALAALCFPESPGSLGGLAFTAAMGSGWAHKSRSTGFARTFYGRDVSYLGSVSHIHCGWLTVALLCSMVVLFYISLTPALDRPSSTNRPD
jgi:hypothetical protein